MLFQVAASSCSENHAFQRMLYEVLLDWNARSVAASVCAAPVQPGELGRLVTALKLIL